jgi:hypothetical protein
MRWFRAKYLWWAALVVFGALSFFGVPLPRDWLAAIEWLTTTETWMHQHIAHPIIFALVIGLATGTVIIPEVWTIVRRRLEGPRLEPQFDPDHQIHRDVMLFEATTGQPIPIKATYVQVHVASVGTAQVNNCAGWITRLERLDAFENAVAALRGTRQLVWSLREAAKTHLPILPEIPQDLDIFRTVEGTNRLELLSLAHLPTW